MVYQLKPYFMAQAVELNMSTCLALPVSAGVAHDADTIP